jgi:hypothetical protein
MYVEALTAAQAELYAEITRRAERVNDQIAELRADLDILYHQINFGPDLNDTGTDVLDRISQAYALVDVAEDLFHEAYEAALLPR